MFRHFLSRSGCLWLLLLQSLTLLVQSYDVVFIVDTTESMRTEFPGVKEAIAKIMEGFAADTLVTKYVLMPFDDAGNGVAAIRARTEGDAATVAAAVDAMQADGQGGTDCREGGWDALLSAVKTYSERSFLFFWSDAAQKGPTLTLLGQSIPVQFARRWNAMARAVYKKMEVNFVMTGYCLPFGTSYRFYSKFAEKTGGQLLIAENADQVSSLTFDY